MYFQQVIHVHVILLGKFNPSNHKVNIKWNYFSDTIKPAISVNLEKFGF